MAISPSNLGQIEATGDAGALFLKKFAGEVLTAFEEKNTMMDKHQVRTITAGKSAQFPIVGKAATTKYHAPGDDILETSGYTQKIKHSERLIHVDRLLTSTVFVDSLEEMINHYDVRSIYSREIGNSLANKLDNNLIRTLAAAARSPRLASDFEPGGFVVSDASEAASASDSQVEIIETANCASQADAFISALFDVAINFDSKDVPEDNRMCMVTPTMYYLLVNVADSNNSGVHMSRDFNDANGSVARGTVLECAGFKIFKSQHLAENSTDINAVDDGIAIGTDTNDPFGSAGVGYNGNLNTTVALCFTPQAIGTVKLKDLSVESEYIMQRQGTVMLAKYSMGHGILRPACAAEIRSAAPQG